MSLRYLSICSGIESASVAWEPLGWSPVAFAEIAAFPSKVLAHHWPDVPNLGDFTAIDVGTLGAVDLLVGGTPCQAFSFAGLRRSLRDARGNLSLAYAKLAHELARSNGLRWAVWENVFGVLSTADNAFGCFLSALVGGDDPIVPVARPRDGKSNAFWRWRKAGIERDEDGNEVAVEAGHVTRWPSAGMVAGPLGRAAWRVLDAQYFGLAQRRRRVFVVVGFGDGADPAAVLFEPKGMRRHPPARGETGPRTAAGAADGFAFDGQDVACADLSHPTATLDTGARHLNRGLHVAHTLRGEGFDASEDGTGRGTPLVPVWFDPRQTDVLVHGDRTGPLDTKFPGPAIAFDTTQITSRENRANPKPGDPCHPLSAAAHPPAIAFTCKDHGQDACEEIAPTLRAMQGRHANAGGQAAVALDLRNALRDPERHGGHYDVDRQGLGVGGDVSYPLTAGNEPGVATAWAVRRLTPTECHRLQGFPDHHCAIPGAKDGPIYMALGNSKAVPVIRWIGQRIARADAALTLTAAE